MYLKMQELLIKGFKEEYFEEELEIIASKYSDDVDVIALRSQLELLPGIAERKEFDGKKMNIQDYDQTDAITKCNRARIYIRSNFCC